MSGSEFDIQVQMRLVPELIRRGYLRQLLLSHDICSLLQLHRYDGPGYDHVPTTIVGRLRSAGASQADLDAMLIENPRRLLVMPA